MLFAVPSNSIDKIIVPTPAEHFADLLHHKIYTYNDSGVSAVGYYEAVHHTTNYRGSCDIRLAIGWMMSISTDESLV